MTRHAIIRLFFALLPFQFALSVGSIDLSLARLAALMLGLWLCIHNLVVRRFFIPRGTVVVSMALFFMWIGTSFFVSDVPLWTMRKFLFFTLFAPLFFFITDLIVHTPSHRATIVTAWIYGTGCAAFVALVQFLLQFIISLPTTITLWGTLAHFFLGTNFGEAVVTYNSWLVHVASMDLMRTVAFFPDPHILAFYTGITLPFSWMLFVQSRRPLHLTIALMITLANLLTFSRGGYMGLCIGGIVALVLLWHTVPSHLRALTACAAITIIGIFLLPQNIVTERFLSSFHAGDFSSTHRIELWRDAWNFTLQKPLFGSGLGAYAHHVDPTADYRTPIYAHNTYLDIAVETGFVGLCFFCAIIFSVCIIFVRHRKDPLAFSGIIALSIFCTHALFDTPLFSVHVFPLLLLLCALASSYENPSVAQ